MDYVPKNVMKRDFAQGLRTVQIIKGTESLFIVGQTLVMCIDRERKINGQRRSVDNGRETSSGMRENIGSCTGLALNKGKDDFLKEIVSFSRKNTEEINEYPDHFNVD